MSLPDDWTCEGQDEIELDFDDEGGPNPDDARDLRIDDELLDRPIPSRRIDDVDVQGGLL